MKAALVRRETFLLNRDDFVEDRFGKIIASFLSVLSSESVIHLLCHHHVQIQSRKQIYIYMPNL